MKKLIILAILIALCSAGSANAAFKLNDYGLAARPLGMGGAFTAVSDDINGLLWNTGGLGLITKKEFTATYVNLYPQMSDALSANFVGYAQPVYGIGTFAAGWMSLIARDLYSENMAVVSYSRKVLPMLSAGVSFKYLSHTYLMTANNAFFQQYGNTKSNFTLDLGMKLNYLNRLYAGIMISNLTQPDIGLYNKDIVPLDLRLGAAYKLGINSSIIQSLTAAADFNVRDSINYLNMGVELPFEIINLQVRGGLNMIDFKLMNLTCGAGYNFRFLNKNFIKLDYAFLFPLQMDVQIGGSHRLSLGLNF